MVGDLSVDDRSTDLETVLDALHDEDCRTIVATLTRPMTVEEISETTDIPLSTTYRKLDCLKEAGLVAEGVELRSDGQHASQYAVVFDEVSIELSDQMSFTVDVSHQTQSADERLADLWSVVREGT